MKYKPFLYLFAAVVLLLAAGSFTVSTENPSPDVHNVSIVKIDSEWRVINSDTQETTVKVKRNETIIWTAEGTDVYFQFNRSDLFSPASSEDNLPDGFTKYLAEGKKLKLKIKGDAPKGTYQYSVFCIKDGQFARGDSPPVIIIE